MIRPPFHITYVYRELPPADDNDSGSDQMIEVVYTRIPGRPETPPAYEHGGLPAEPAEIEIHSAIDQFGDEVDLTDDEIFRIEEAHEEPDDYPEREEYEP